MLDSLVLHQPPNARDQVRAGLARRVRKHAA
jgi:hypothetical protein